LNSFQFRNVSSAQQMDEKQVQPFVAHRGRILFFRL
jgi:hypothetical protein